jgi:hypothetical protein
MSENSPHKWTRPRKGSDPTRTWDFEHVGPVPRSPIATYCSRSLARGSLGMARRLARTNGLVWSGILLVGLKLAGLALFSRGFFPVKPLLASYTAASGAQGADPPFSRLVFVLVDALRR